MPESVEDRLIALECRIAHHERMAEELSEVMAAQARTIDALTAQARSLRRRLGEIEAGVRDPHDEPPPPHY